MIYCIYGENELKNLVDTIFKSIIKIKDKKY